MKEKIFYYSDGKRQFVRFKQGQYVIGIINETLLEIMVEHYEQLGTVRKLGYGNALIITTKQPLQQLRKGIIYDEVPYITPVLLPRQKQVDPTETEIYPTDKICIGFKKTPTKKQLTDIIDMHSLHTTDRLREYSGLFSVPEADGTKTFDVANKIYTSENPLIDFAHPHFLTSRKLF